MPFVAPLLAVIVTPVYAVFWALDSWRGGRRNRKGRCAQCARSWNEVDGPRYIVQARYVCEECADTLRRHATIILPTLLGLSAVGLLVGIVDATLHGLWGSPAAWLLVVPPAAVGGASLASVFLLRRANRRELRRDGIELLPDYGDGRADLRNPSS